MSRSWGLVLPLYVTALGQSAHISHDDNFHCLLFSTLPARSSDSRVVQSDITTIAEAWQHGDRSPCSWYSVGGPGHTRAFQYYPYASRSTDRLIRLVFSLHASVQVIPCGKKNHQITGCQYIMILSSPTVTIHLPHQLRPSPFYCANLFLPFWFSHKCRAPLLDSLR